MASISKIYIEGRQYDINATINEDEYKVVIFNSENNFIQNLPNLSIGNFCFVVKQGELFLCQIVDFDSVPPSLKEENYTFYKNESMKKAWKEFQITNLINSKMSQISTLFSQIKSTSESYQEALNSLAAGAVKIFPSLTSFLNTYGQETVESDVTSENIANAGTYIITLGRYNINDGGGATYYIVNDRTVVNDNVFFYALNEGRSLVMLYDEYIHFAQLGGKANDESAAGKNTEILNRFTTINSNTNKKSLTLKFGSGTYFFNSTNLTGENYTLEGTTANTNLELGVLSGQGTIIAYSPKENDPSYLWTIGNPVKTNSYLSNISLKNLTFTGGKGNDNKITFKNGVFSALDSLVKICRVQKSCFENLSFNGFQGAGLILQSVYASSFDNLKFWHGYCLGVRESEDESASVTNKRRFAAMIFGSELAQETSDLHFGNIMFKNIIGSNILFDKDCNVNLVNFDSIFIDAGRINFDKEGNTLWSNVKYISAKNLTNLQNVTKIAAINIASQSTTQNIVFKTFNCKNFSSWLLTVNESQRFLLDSFLYFETPGTQKGPSKFNFCFENIMHSDQILDILLGRFYTDGQLGPEEFMLQVNNLTTNGISPVLFDTNGAPRVKLCQLGPNCLNNLKAPFESVIDYIKDNLPQTTFSTGNYLPAIATYNNKSIAKNHLTARMVSTTFKPTGSNTTFDAYAWAPFIPIAGNVCRIRYTSENTIFYGFFNYLTKEISVGDESWKLNKTNGAWAWADLSMGNYVDNTWALIFYSKSNNTVNDLLDVFYFK